MWEGKFDNNLKTLFEKYEKQFGCEPDGYEEIAYYAMDYDEFSGYIEKCLEKNLEIDEIVQ